jgi:hypothetical protein
VTLLCKVFWIQTLLYVQVEIMMALEEKFDLELEEDGAEKITTVQEAADMIAKKVAEK